MPPICHPDIKNPLSEPKYLQCRNIRYLGFDKRFLIIIWVAWVEPLGIVREGFWVFLDDFRMFLSPNDTQWLILNKFGKNDFSIFSIFFLKLSINLDLLERSECFWEGKISLFVEKMSYLGRQMEFGALLGHDSSHFKRYKSIEIKIRSVLIL